MSAKTESIVASTVTLLPLDKIKTAAWNPPSRTEENRLRKLLASIDDVGLLYPLLVDEDNNLIDGHRRLACARKLGWKAIPVIKVSSEFEHVYGSIQSAAERINGNDLLGIYLRNKNALLSDQRRRPERIEEICGRKSVEMLYKAGLTYGTFDIALRVFKYLQDDEMEIAQILAWTVKHGLGGTLRHLLDAGVKASTLKNAILQDRKLTVKLTAS